jgi:hypothetical protein
MSYTRVGMDTKSRTPRKGEKVSLLGLDNNTFEVLTVRYPSHVVDLRLIEEPKAVMNDVSWDLLVYCVDRS